MPSRITSVPLPAEGSSPAARHGRGGQHAALECDWAHQELIGGGGVAGGDSSERRRRTCCGSVSGEASDGEDQHAAMGATMGFRDEL
jgi:hypothetical protein